MAYNVFVWAVRTKNATTSIGYGFHAYIPYTIHYLIYLSPQNEGCFFREGILSCCLRCALNLRCSISVLAGAGKRSLLTVYNRRVYFLL